MSFTQIKGQDFAINNLKKFIKTGKVPPAMIFYGPAGVGKAKVAVEFARALNCQNLSEDFEPCDMCQSCKQIEMQTHPDIIFADYAYQAALLKEEVEEQQNIKIETVRSLTTASQQKAVAAKWKVFIIDKAERLVPAAANALLKFIEEPPQNTVWILISSKRETMLSTIKSRCQSIPFAPLSTQIITEILQDNYIENDLAQKAAQFAEGSTENAFLIAGLLEDFAPLSRDAGFATQVALNLPRTLAQARPKVNIILDMLTQKIHKNWLQANDEKTKNKLAKLIQDFVFYKKALKQNVAPQMVAETALVKAQISNINIQEIL
ncbi:MAG: DNA polymerase III subunit delta' [Elusimicrobiaceae bacterium]|nr:DNA polymerase III subunit delta' [Elusimicrobiaceae bacterium]